MTDRTPSNEDSILNISEQLMKEIILPELTQEVNTSPIYAPLRQIYHSLILAEWFKRKHKHSNSIYSLSINQSYIKGLESETPWEKDSFYQQYLKSYSEGEYKLEANLFGLRRMYWSGGVLLGLSPEINPNFNFIIQEADKLNKTLQLPKFTSTREANLALALYKNNSGATIGKEFSGTPEIVKLPIQQKESLSVEETPKQQEAPSPEKGLSAKNQPKPTGASLDEQSAGSTLEKKDESASSALRNDLFAKVYTLNSGGSLVRIIYDENDTELKNNIDKIQKIQEIFERIFDHTIAKLFPEEDAESIKQK